VAVLHSVVQYLEETAQAEEVLPFAVLKVERKIAC